MTATWNEGPLAGFAADQQARTRIQKWLGEPVRLLKRLELANTHYAVFNIDVGAGSADITAAYHETVIALTRAFNDLRDAAPCEQLRGFRTALARVREAYDVLGDPARRAEYDDHLKKNMPAQPEGLTGFEILGADFVAVGIDADTAVHSSDSNASPVGRSRASRAAARITP